MIASHAYLQVLVDAIAGARARREPLLLRGGGTKDFYGGVPRGVPLELAPLNGISSYEPTELVITALAGTPLASIEAELALRGQYLAFEPPRYAPGGTLGGMVAAGLSGPSRARLGCVRDYVLGATILNGRGELMSFGGQVMKNVAGYDVSRLMAGALGVLGVLCEVSLKVVPVPPRVRTLVFRHDQAQALAMLAALNRQPLPVHAGAWHDQTLYLRLAGSEPAVAAAGERLGGDVLEAPVAEAWWTALRDQTHAFFTAPGTDLWRLSLPPTAPVVDLPGEQFIEWGGGLRWWRTPATATLVRERAAALGGHATRFRTQDAARDPFTPLADPLRRLHRELKAAFDPDGLFNPGRLYPEL